MLTLQIMGGVSEHRTTVREPAERVMFSARTNVEVSVTEFNALLQRLRDAHKDLGVPHPGTMVHAECRTIDGPVILECEHDRVSHLVDEYLGHAK
jgi:hypothetical protein